jgi:predicted DNA-binding transcriptional regulator AlpA
MADDDALIGARKVRQLLDDCSEMQIWRLLNDERYRDLNFPRPVKINIRNYWRRSEVLEWIKQRPTVAANYGDRKAKREVEAAIT